MITEIDGLGNTTPSHGWLEAVALCSPILSLVLEAADNHVEATELLVVQYTASFEGCSTVTVGKKQSL